MLDTSIITTPTLLLNEQQAQRNIKSMATKARRHSLRFRPHFKTHQSAVIGGWFRDAGVSAITVSSVRMAAYFAAAGWDDITIAFPTNVREMAEIDRIASTVRLGLLVDSVATVQALGSGLTSPVDLWMEVDAGYRRSGVEADDHAHALNVAAAAAFRHLRLRGLLTHAGNSYGIHSRERLQEVHLQTVAALIAVRDALQSGGFGRLEISVGDTPIATLVEDLGPVDELRPGNFLFYDCMQHAAGVCREEEIAVAVACPVVAIYPQRHEVVLYGGAVHLSKDSIARAGALDFGHAAALGSDGWGPAFPDVWLRSLSQEHGIVRATPEAFARHLAPLAVGDLVAVLPIHSCLTADLLKRYLTLDGETIAMMAV